MRACVQEYCLSGLGERAGAGESEGDGGLKTQEEGGIERMRMQGGTRWKGASSRYCSIAKLSC